MILRRLCIGVYIQTSLVYSAHALPKKEKEKHLVNHVARVRGYGPAMHTATRHLEERLTTSFDQMYFLDSK